MQVDKAEVLLFLRGVFDRIFPGQVIDMTPHLCARDVVGWDSFRQVEILLALEERYAIRIRARELVSVEDVGQLADLTLQKIEVSHRR
jgi:acyl carrier protein